MSKKSTAGKIITITTFSLASLHIINKVYSALAIKDDLLYTSNSHYYNWTHGKIHYTKTGQGSPLLLIHDISPECSNYNWKALTRKFSKNHTVYTIDLLGCGKSDKPNITYTQYLYVLQIQDFINNVIKESTDIVSTGKSNELVLLGSTSNTMINKKILINPYSLCTNTKKTWADKIMPKLIELPIIGSFLYNINFNSIKIQSRLKDEFYRPSNVKRHYANALNESAHISAATAKYVYSSSLKNYFNSSVSRLLDSQENIYVLLGEELPQKECLIDYFDSKEISYSVIDQSKCHPEVENVSELHNRIDSYLNN